MNKLLIGLLTLMGIAFSGTNLHATTLAAPDVSTGFSVSNFTTDRGLAVREDLHRVRLQDILDKGGVNRRCE